MYEWVCVGMYRCGWVWVGVGGCVGVCMREAEILSMPTPPFFDSGQVARVLCPVSLFCL